MKHTKAIAIFAALLMGVQLVACGSAKSDDGEFDYSDGLDDNGYFKGVKAADIVTLPDYMGLEYDASLLIASEDEVQSQLDGVLENYSTYERIMDRAVEDGDTVNIDYVGSIDGVEFDGGSTGGTGADVTIGVTSYIDDFLEQLIGHKPGETLNVEVTFPDPYENKAELSGKDAVFKTTINYIQGEMIKADLTTDIASDYGFDSTEAMIKNIEEWVVDMQKFNFFTEILGKATADNIPQSVLDYVINYDLSQYNYYAQIYGMTVDELIVQLLGYDSKQAYIDERMDDYKSNAVQYLAAQAIAEKEGLVATDKDIEEAGYTDAQIEQFGKPYVKQYILFQSIIPDYIIANGKVK